MIRVDGEGGPGDKGCTMRGRERWLAAGVAGAWIAATLSVACGSGLKPASDVSDAALVMEAAGEGASGAGADAGGETGTPGDSGLPSWPSAPVFTSGASVFVVDSTGHLFAFDSAGHALGSVAVPKPIGALNGGALTLAPDAVYVTVGQPANTVAAFDVTLTRKDLPDGSFPGLHVPRGLAFDWHDERFVVTNGGAGVGVFGASGSPVPFDGGAFAPYYGPSGVAYDPDDHSIWIANYAGFPTTQYGIAEFDESGEAVQTFSPATQFVAPGMHQEPYSIAVCSRAATGGAPLVVVGFLDDQSHQGTPAVQAYTTDGAAHGPPVSGPFAGPYGLSCSSKGRLYVADQGGLRVVDLVAGGAAPAGGFAGLTPPIYGVLAND